MNKIYIISLIIAVFLCSASFAWAGFNYDSLGNYYLLDSILKLDGNYIAVGDVVPTSALDVLLMSGNMIFLGNGPFDGAVERKIGVDGDETFILSNKIFVQSDTNPFIIASAKGQLNIESNNNTIEIDSGLKVAPKGLSLLPEVDQSMNKVLAGTLYAEQVLADEIRLLTNNDIIIPKGTQLTLGRNAAVDATEATGAASAFANEILIDNKTFCKFISWSIEGHKANATMDGPAKGDIWTGTNQGDLPNNSSCPVDGGVATVGGGGLTYTSKTCCPENHYVFDLDATGDGSRAKMVCCRAADPFPWNANNP
ncbi:hypothetical protein ACFL2U_02870 [Patescibacteria group bacterium]